MVSAHKPSALSLSQAQTLSLNLGINSLFSPSFILIETHLCMECCRSSLVDYFWVWIVGRSSLVFSQIGAYFGEKVRLHLFYFFHYTQNTSLLPNLPLLILFFIFSIWPYLSAQAQTPKVPAMTLYALSPLRFSLFSKTSMGQECS